MRRLAAAAILLAGVCECFGGRVSVVTWNLQWFPGQKPTSTALLRATQMSGAKDGLIKLSPDIFCAQEVRNWEAFDELVSVVPRLAPLVVSTHRDERSGGALSIQQIAIASKLPAVGAWSEVFRTSEDAPPRGFAFAAIELGEKGVLLVYSVHLKSNIGNGTENTAKREEAARQIVDHAGRMAQDYPRAIGTVVCGDFNTSPGEGVDPHENTFGIFLAAGFHWPWARVPREARVTHHGGGKYPPATFDHFLFRGEARVASCRAIELDGVSDHRPVELVLEWDDMPSGRSVGGSPLAR